MIERNGCNIVLVRLGDRAKLSGRENGIQVHRSSAQLTGIADVRVLSADEQNMARRLKQARHSADRRNHTRLQRLQRPIVVDGEDRNGVVAYVPHIDKLRFCRGVRLAEGVKKQSSAQKSTTDAHKQPQVRE